MASSNPFDNVTNTQRPTSVAEQLQQLRAINDALMSESVAAMQSGGTSGSTGGISAGSVLGTIGSVVGGGGLGLSSLISGLAGLFGGGGASAPAPVTPYMQPLPIQLNAGFSAGNAGGPFAVDSAQGGQPRPMTSNAGGGQITVQVQALDSQSFLDHSNDIAMAVRQAMLETTVLNDVIREV